MRRSIDDAKIREWLIAYVAASQEIPANRIDAAASFDELGLDSVAIVTMTEDLGRWLDRTVDPLTPYDHVTITDLADFLGDGA